MPDNSVFYISDVCIPHSWYTVEENVNNKLFLQIEYNNFAVDIRLTLDSKNYTGGDLAVEMLTQLNKVVYFTDKFTFTYDSSRHQIIIIPDFGYTFKVLTKSDISSQLNGTWAGLDYNITKSYDINTYMLKNE